MKSTAVVNDSELGRFTLLVLMIMDWVISQFDIKLETLPVDISVLSRHLPKEIPPLCNDPASTALAWLFVRYVYRNMNYQN